jgi:hypothetical protein
LDQKEFNVEDMPVVNPAPDNEWIHILSLLEQIGPIITIVSFGLAFLILYQRTRKNP